MVLLVEKIGPTDFLAQLRDSPARLAWVEANLGENEKVAALLEAVDESPYSLRQWIDAFMIIGSWLDARGCRADFFDKLGYLSCACSAAGPSARLESLAGVVREMLDTHGFELAEEK